MNVLETRIYRGPNLYAPWPVIRLRMELGELEWFPTGKLPGFSDRLVKLIPTLAEHTCSYGEPGGFVRRLNEGDGTWLGHVMEHVAIELQCLAGTPVTFGKTRSHGLPPGQCRRTSACSTPTTSGWRPWPSTAPASRSG